MADKELTQRPGRCGDKQGTWVLCSINLQSIGSEMKTMNSHSSKVKVLSLQQLGEIRGGGADAFGIEVSPMDWSTSSSGCGGVGANEWSTTSNGCR
jgi:hypothetical protein